MEIFRTKTFKKAIKAMGASEDEVQAVEKEIAADHSAGDVIPGTGGARKIRFALGSKGKRGGARAVYVALVEEDTAYMITAYPKSKQEDLSTDDKKAIKEFIDKL